MMDWLPVLIVLLGLGRGGGVSSVFLSCLVLTGWIALSEEQCTDLKTNTCMDPPFEVVCNGNQLDVRICCGTEDSISFCRCDRVRIDCDGIENGVSVVNGISFDVNRQYFCPNVHNFSSTSRVGTCTLHGLCTLRSEDDIILLIEDSCLFSQALTSRTPLRTSVAATASVPEGGSGRVISISTNPTSSGNSTDKPKVNRTPLLVASGVGAAVVSIMILLVLVILSAFRVLKMRECRSIKLYYTSEMVQKFDPNFSPVKIGVTIPTSLSSESVVHSFFKPNHELELPDHRLELPDHELELPTTATGTSDVLDCPSNSYFMF